MKDEIRRLQKDGEYKFEGLTREESRNRATKLAKAARRDDLKNGIDCKYGIARDAFGYYSAVVIG